MTSRGAIKEHSKHNMTQGYKIGYKIGYKYGSDMVIYKPSKK